MLVAKKLKMLHEVMMQAKTILETCIVKQRGSNALYVDFNIPSIGDWEKCEHLFMTKMFKHAWTVEIENLGSDAVYTWLDTATLQRIVQKTRDKADCSTMRPGVLAWILYETYRIHDRRVQQRIQDDADWKLAADMFVTFPIYPDPKNEPVCLAAAAELGQCLGIEG